MIITTPRRLGLYVFLALIAIIGLLSLLLLARSLTADSLLPDTDFMIHLGIFVGLTLPLFALIILGLTYRRWRPFQGAVLMVLALVLVTTPIIIPLSQSHSISNVTADFLHELPPFEFPPIEAPQKEPRQWQQLEEELSGMDFDPQVDPLSESLSSFVDTGPGPITRPPGLSSPLLSPHDMPSADEINCADPPDDLDGDGLTCPIEAKLGTNPDLIDTDSDGISDRTEVEGFVDSNNQRWYLNPLTIDSNGDGLTDIAECPQLEDIDSFGNLVTLPSGVRCINSDTDPTPDVFDFDNDGDGVPDAVDSSPNYTGTLTTTAQDHVEINLTGQDIGRSLYIEFEIRPTNPDHLWYTNNVLQWPNDDNEGQIRRVTHTTFAGEGRTGPKTENGDIMTTPLLEIAIPSAPGGLPVDPNFSGNILTAELSEWLDKDAMDMYGISVSQSEEDGTIYAYIPLALIQDQVGDTPVAWGGRMYYRPSSSVWGGNHRARLIWMISALVDTCNTDAKPDDVDFNAWCVADEPDSWDTGIQVIQSYYEEFHLTGLVVQEHHGMDSAVIAQTNALTSEYEDSLWHLANGLQQTFVEGRLVNNERFDIAEIARRFDNDSSTYADGSPQRWDIPKPDLDVNIEGDYPFTSGTLHARLISRLDRKSTNAKVHTKCLHCPIP